MARARKTPRRAARRSITPVLDGASEYYGAEREARDPRHGQDDPALIRHPETGEKTATPENL